MTPLQIALIVAAAAAAGAINSVAGGGSFLTFPTLLFAGLASKVANATSTTALWPASVASAVAYRGQLKHERRVVLVLALVSLVGGVAGAYLLLATPEKTFTALIPFLLGGATLLFAVGPRANAYFRRHARAAPADDLGGLSLGALACVQLVIAVYGGYFGAGIGILMLAAYAAVGMTNVHAMNGLKTVMGSIMNGVALLAFVLAPVLHLPGGNLIDWKVALIMVGGAVAGGYFGAHYAQRVSAAIVRRVILAIGVALTLYFFWRAYA